MSPRGYTRNAAWGKLRRSLQVLRDTASVFPPLSSAVESILACIDEFETAARSRHDYEDLATELTALSDTINRHQSSSLHAFTSNSIARVAVSIDQQIKEVRAAVDRVQREGIRSAGADEELVRHYRRIQGQFQRLQTNLSMSTWSLANEHLVHTRLEGLNPIKQAAYDSSLSAELSRRGCTKGTRVGVLTDLEDWLSDPASQSIFWMNGMAGTGKTTIAYSFCEQAERSKLLAASFFCTRSSGGCGGAAQILPTIAYQLARYSPPYRSALCESLGKNPDIGSRGLQKQFNQLLIEPLQRIKDAMLEHPVVIIDALDECEDHSGVELILDMLLRHASEVPLKFLITSRPEPEIYNKLVYSPSREVMHLHNVKESVVREDIQLYLSQELESMSPRQADVEQLVERAGTLFLYAATLVRYIRFGKRFTDPGKRLQSVVNRTSEARKAHSEINALYDEILKSALGKEMEKDEIEDIRAVLRTVLSTPGPISVDSIATSAGIDELERVVYALDPLRSVLRQSEETGLVSPLHASFSDFMLDKTRSGLYF